jgi:hypothetical protein
MTISTKQKRLDKIEIQLTSKEWAIKLADEIRKCQDSVAHIKACSKKTLEGTVYKPYRALVEQAEERYPGTKPEAVRARGQLARNLRTEYHTLKRLISGINLQLGQKIEALGLKAALKLSTLHTLILQDAFGRTAKKAALWIQEYKAADPDEEEECQIMHNELAAYTDVSFAETQADSLPLGTGLRLRFPSLIESWVQEIVRLIAEVFSHQAAVQAIQDKYLDGHPFIFRDLEARLNETMKTIEDGVFTFNEYLKTREMLFKAEWDQEDREEGIAYAIPGEREGKLAIDLERIKSKAAGRLVTVLIEEWMQDAKDVALLDTLEGTPEGEAYKRNLWERTREQWADSEERVET